jgi:uncharacterized 2Fe-2S/4Fe-4S cluster protein (DUF4445 family)
MEGDFPKHGIHSEAAHLSPIGPVELDFAQRRGLADGHRLGCTARLRGDLLVDVPAESQVHRQVVRKEALPLELEIDPVITQHYVEVAAPDLADPSSDLRRLLAALEQQWDLTGLDVDPAVLPGLQAALRAGDWKVTAAVTNPHPPVLARSGGVIVSVRPGFQDYAYGVAFDIGSTTVAGHLADLHTGEVLASAGAMNPQIRFGEDLMSRVSYVMMNPGGAADLTAAVRDCINGLIGELVEAAGVERDDVLAMTAVGNPIMHHLFLGFDPIELGGAPFALVTDLAVERRAADLALDLLPSARIYVLPCIAGHVGADAAGMVLAEGPYRRDELTLAVDVGTNAEIVLGNRHRLLAASSPTGPAFEGAQISSGQRAAPGAIERVRIDRTTLEPRIRAIGDRHWSDEPGFSMVPTGICGSGIIEAIAELFLAGIISPDGVIIESDRTARVRRDDRTFSYLLWEGEPDIWITQNDVRAIQLAKAALHAGCKLLMDHMGTTTVDRIRLAGAFGSHIDPLYALVLGLVPDCDLEAVGAAGNAAGTGALMTLLNRDKRAEIEQVVRTIEKVETAVEPRFQEHFVNAMAFPHRIDDYRHLAAEVELPARAEMTGARRGRRGRTG